jgi:hypothetical protein
VSEITTDEDTFNTLVRAAQNTWITRVRDGQLYALYEGSKILRWARRNEESFLTYCCRHSVGGDSLESRTVELILATDGDAEPISRERRAEYAACIGWFADRELCPETDPDKAVALAREKSRITGIAKEYRGKKDAGNPKAKAAKLKGQATKARRQGPEPGVRRAASAAAARDFAEQMDSKPSLIARAHGRDPDSCVANGDSDATLAFLSRHGISAGLREELDDGHHVQIYLRVWNDTEKQFQLFGPALDPDLADNLADIIVREHNERSLNVAEAA